MAQASLYWHDYETFGIDPQRDRPSQFAGVRTDLELNVIDDPMVIYCKPPADYLPHPEACLLTGITPQLADAKGSVEAEFCQRIHQQFSQPHTCSLGYNSIRFDDEFTRNCLYRNFYDPYAREWQNGNSRWDLIDVVRATQALRPDGISWPIDIDIDIVGEGRNSFKLEELTRANGIAHEGAHDALSDVYATIALAKLIKKVQPKLYDYLWQHRTKSEASKLLQLDSYRPLVHVSGRYSSQNNCLAVILPICRHPSNTNGVVVYDLSVDPEPLISLSIEAIQQRLFTAVADLPAGIVRVPLKTVHLNKCPVLAPISVLRPQDLERLQLNLAVCYDNIEKIRQADILPHKIASVFSRHDFSDSSQSVDPDLALYRGGFFSDADKQKFTTIRNTSPDCLKNLHFDFNDARLHDMLFRYRARNYPEYLAEDERLQWREFCANRVNGQSEGGGITYNEYVSQLAVLREKTVGKEQILAQLEEYAAGRSTKTKTATGDITHSPS